MLRNWTEEMVANFENVLHATKLFVSKQLKWYVYLIYGRTVGLQSYTGFKLYNTVVQQFPHIIKSSPPQVQLLSVYTERCSRIIAYILQVALPSP